MACLTMTFFSPLTVVFADENDVQFEIIPAVEPSDLQNINTTILDSDEDIRDIYNQQADTLGAQDGGTALQVTSGVMNRDTIINYAIMVLRFLSQLGLLIGWLMIVYTGWKYIMAVISGDSPPSSDLIMNAIKGILVIIFSFAILRILYWAFF
jgi:TRAP-type C4-dicarboxylate transport system permease small subunit